MIKKILIVDDSPIARKMLKSCLPKDQGFEFEEACNGQEGFEKYKSISPDLTFMDLTMPVMTGYEAIEEIIKYDKNALIIVVTADVQLKAIKTVLDSGAYMVLRKPLKKEDLQVALLKAQDTLQQVE
ncbi:MAG: response regulator [Nitrospiraceae bacterium]|nr:MAG: response regulator [Nitrospiraceae bacterium]